FYVVRFRALELRLYFPQPAGLDSTRRCATASVAWRRRPLYCRHGTRFDYQCPGCNQTRDFHIAKFGQLAPHLAIDGLLPNSLSRLEIARHERPVDPRIDGRRIES